MPRIPTRHAISIVLLAVGLFFLPSGCDQEFGSSQAGVTGTGNAGRIVGSIITTSNTPEDLEVRLLRIAAPVDSIVAATSTDSKGNFRFDSASIGRYRVEAWRHGRHLGSSESFLVQDTGTVKLLIVLVEPKRITLDLRVFGNVDSVFFNYPDIVATPGDSIWNLQLLDTSGRLFVRTTTRNGSTLWLSMDLTNVDGNLRINGARLDEITTDPSRLPDIDTSALSQISSATGRVAAPDSVSIRGGKIFGFQNLSTAEAWEGRPRDSAVVSSEGAFRFHDVYPDLILRVECRDANGGLWVGMDTLHMKVVSDTVLPAIQLFRPARLAGILPIYDSLRKTLPQGGKLALQVRSTSLWTFLDENAWGFDNVAPGLYEARVVITGDPVRNGIIVWQDTVRAK